MERVWKVGEDVLTYVGVGVIEEITPWDFIVRMPSGMKMSLPKNQAVRPD